MNILEIIPHLQSGGGEKFVVDLSNQLAKMGHQCTLMTLFDPNENDILRQYIDSSVSTISLGKKMGVDIRCMFNIYRYIKKHKPQVVHLHLNAITYILLSVLLCRKVKYVATIHSEAKREAGSGINKWVRKFLFKFKLVTPITISNESKISFENFYNIQADLIVNGASSYHKHERMWDDYHKGVDLLFLHAGRINKVKNQLMLISVFERIVELGANVKLLIAGRVDDDALYNQIKSRESEHIVYIGEQSDVRNIMLSCDVFCLSSLMEGMPITIIEAFSAGCVPICTPVGGCVNMIKNGINGFISKDCSEEAYFEMLQKVVSASQEEFKKIKEQASKSFFDYSIEKCAKSYIKVFINEKD